METIKKNVRNGKVYTGRVKRIGTYYRGYSANSHTADCPLFSCFDLIGVILFEDGTTLTGITNGKFILIQPEDVVEICAEFEKGRMYLDVCRIGETVVK